MKLPLINAVALALLCPLGFGQEIKLLPSDGALDDQFGESVAISGTTAIIGAYKDDDNDSDSGSAYLFDTVTGTQIAKLLASDGVAGDDFGRCVAISGSTAIVGARYDGDNGSSSGSAYLFDTTTGTQIAKLLPNDGGTGDYFGAGVSISGTIAIVGAPLDDDAGTDSGSAYLFDAATGAQLFKLTPNDGASHDYFGDSVAISGTTAIVGAYRDDDNGGDSGSAYLFDTTTGTQITKLLPSDGAGDDYFGYSVAISGVTASVGAHNDDGNSGSGSAYLFDAVTGAQLFKLTPSDGASSDYFGYSVALSDSNAIAGAPNNDDNGPNSGCSYLHIIDCNTDGILDVLEIAMDPNLDCDQNGYIDECELALGIGDCNINGLFDACECLGGSVADCNANLTPDICEGLPDCDLDGVPDECEDDCNSNGEPDDCEVGNDCNSDGIPDDCESDNDCNSNGVPDDCEGLADCNKDRIPDECQADDDCDGDGELDLCEIASGTEPDLNTNGIPDSCECLATNYCTASPNTAGSGVLISITGIPSISLNSLGIYATGGPTNQPGLYFHGPGTASMTFGEGIRCVSTPILRVGPPVFFGAAGNASKQLDMNSLPLINVQPADTRYFQLWYRDPQGGPFGFNLSNGLEITFCP